MTTPPADSDLPGFSLMSLQIKRFRSGFTLVEVVIAIGVFSVVVLSVGALFLHALRINAETEESMRAMDILRCESESLRARPWDKSSVTTGYKQTDGIYDLYLAQTADSAGNLRTPFDVGANPKLPNIDASRTIVINSANIATITLTLRWGPTDRQRTRTANLIICKNGLLSFR